MKVLHADSGREMRGGQWQVISLHEGLGAGSLLLCRAGSPLMQECRRRGLAVEALTISSLASCSRNVDVTHAHDARATPGAQRLVVLHWSFRAGWHFLSGRRGCRGGSIRGPITI